jgi:hypothetical protein
MIPLRAIDIAIQGGWEPYGCDFTDMPIDARGVCTLTDEDAQSFDFGIYDTEYPDQGYYYAGTNFRTAFDATFWQSLGKELGWLPDADELITADKHQYGWKVYARRFYDLILTNGNTTTFWNDILSGDNFVRSQETPDS